MPFRLLFFCFILATTVSCTVDREAWTTSKVKGSPEPPPPYKAEAIWPHITFSEGLDITHLETQGKLFVTERYGKIWMLPSDLSTNPDKAKLAADLTETIPDLLRLLGLAFHPEFERNGECFLYYVVNTRKRGVKIELSRFKMNDELRILPDDYEVLLTFLANGHTGGDIQFGPDGMLYVPIGDLSPPSPPDPNRAGQDLGQLASSILRIDVDKKDPGLGYHIPEDNPFHNVDGARPEIWAYGFRNPWKICFHPETGDLWTGDVGWEMWEMVYRVEKGGNYGWSIMEGPNPTLPDQDPGPSPVTDPITSYSHLKGASITGGYFVSSPRIPDLQGAYVYGDYVTGKIWALRWDGRQVTRNWELADTRQAIVTFGQDSSGDAIFLELGKDKSLQRLVPNTDPDQSSEFPVRLSDTGIFLDVAGQTPSPGVHPFNILSPAWQDGYDSHYWVGLPGSTGITTTTETRRRSPVINYIKPEDMVLAKTIHKNGHRVETQILHWDGYWKGYSYQWNETQTDAYLVRKDGLETTVQGKPYRFPSRDECMRCHGSNFNRPLAFFPGQLNRDGQLKQFRKLGLVDRTFVKMARRQPLCDPYDVESPLELRARSWLHSNCSHCHKVSGGSGLTNRMNAAVPTQNLELLNSAPVKGDFGLDHGSLIEPGNPYQSILYYRIATKGAGHMPMIGPKTLDRDGIRLIHDWIRSLDPDIPVAEATLPPDNVEEALALYHMILSGELSDNESREAIAASMKSKDPFVINLFAGFSVE